MRKKSIDVQETVKRNIDEYAYMDDMPIEGWIWEFVRREPHFRSAFETIKTVTAKYKVISEPWPEGTMRGQIFILYFLKLLLRRREENLIKIPLWTLLLFFEQCLGK